MKLSIITPYYDTLSYTKKLAERLEPQLTKEVEWIIVDDGCNESELNKLNARVIHLDHNSGGASIPRNVGLDNAIGEYISFIDSDDLITDNYIQTILNKTKEDWDYCYLSWKSQYGKTIIDYEPPSWNCCVWNCIYKKELIGNNRFDAKYKMAEDFDFNKRVRKGKRGNIKEILYIYNADTPNSLCKQGQIYNLKYKG